MQHDREEMIVDAFAKPTRPSPIRPPYTEQRMAQNVIHGKFHLGLTIISRHRVEHEQRDSADRSAVRENLQSCDAGEKRRRKNDDTAAHPPRRGLRNNERHLRHVDQQRSRRETKESAHGNNAGLYDPDGAACRKPRRAEKSSTEHAKQDRVFEKRSRTQKAKPLLAAEEIETSGKGARGFVNEAKFQHSLGHRKNCRQ